MVALPTTGRAYLPIPLSGLIKEEPLDFPLYLQTGERRWVLYRDVMAEMGEDHVGRLRSEGIDRLFIRGGDQRSYYRRVEAQLDSILRDRNVDVQSRTQVLYGVAIGMAREVLADQPDKDEIKRASKVIGSAAQWILGEKAAFTAIRQVLKASPELANHSLTVSLLSIGLARQVLSAEPNTLAKAGLAGFLHDIGRVGVEGDTGPEHAVRGYECLRVLGIDKEICDVALYHHECADGSGFPRGLRGDAIPPLCALVGIVNTFDTIYSGHKPPVGVFDSLRIMAQAYRGRFAKHLTAQLVELFTA